MEKILFTQVIITKDKGGYMTKAKSEADCPG